MKRRMIALCIAIALVCALLPTTLLTASATTYSGTCGAEGDGSNLRWTLDTDTGVLIISGTGRMKTWDTSYPPWCGYRSAVRTVVIDNGVTEIGEAAFDDCTSLTSVTIPDSVMYIGAYAFFDCCALTSITIPNGVLGIWEATFSGCTSLTSVAIPTSVTEIEEQAFFNCTGLKDVYFTGTEEEWNAISSDTGNECLTNATIHFESTGSSTPSGNEYVLTTSLKDGDQVIIYNASAGKAMSEDTVSTYYRAGADVTVSGNKIVTNDSKIVWTVKTSGSGFTFANDAGETLSATKGLSFAATDNVWAINPATTANSVYIVSTTATGASGDPKSIEWYDKYNEFATYYYSTNSEAIFAMQLFVKNGNIVTVTPSDIPTQTDIIRFSELGNLYAYIGDNTLYDILSEDALLKGEFSAKIDTSIIAADDIVWSTSNESILKIVDAELGYTTVFLKVEALAEGDVTLTAEVPGVVSKAALVHVTKPNRALIQAFCEKEYYYSDGVFIGETYDFTTTPEIYVSVLNQLKTSFLNVEPSENNALHNITFRASISGKDFSLSPTEYSNTYSQTYETVSLEKLADDLIMLYPYEFDGNSIGNGKSYTVTVQISGDEIETSTRVFYININDFASPTVEQHVSFIQSNGTYRAFRTSDFPGEMMALTYDDEYKWDYATCELFGEAIKISNPYELVVTDVVTELAQSKTLEHWKIKLLSNEWKSLYDSLKKGIDTIVNDNYDEIFYKFDSKEGVTASVTKLFKKSKYTGNKPVEGDELYETILDVFGSDKNVGKINGIFKAADKTSQGIKLIKSGLGVINSIRDTINYYTALNAFASLDQSIKEAMLLVAEDAKGDNDSLYKALNRYVRTETDASGFAQSIASVTVEGAYRTSYSLLNSQFGSAVKSLIWSYVGTMTLANGMPLSAVSIGGTSILTYIGAVTVGIGLGLGIGDFLTNGDSVSSEMRKVVVAGVLSEHVNNVLSRAESNVLTLRSQEASDAFEGAFALYTAVEKYSRAHTIKALEAKNESIIGKLTQIYRNQDYAGTIAGLQWQMVTLDNLQCHSNDHIDTISEWSKIVQIKCPVDVFLYDTSDNLLVSIEADAVTYADSNISAIVIGSEKYVALPATMDYTIKIVATDQGTMSYSVIERDGIEEVQRVNFYDIPLITDQAFDGAIPSESMASSNEYALLTVVNNETVIISANEEIVGPEMITVSIEVIGNGSAGEQLVVSKGDRVTLTAVPAEGETFEGWYLGETLISTEMEYRFCPSENCTYIAKFSNNIAHEHQYVETITNPTCTEQGYTTHTCVCGDSYVDSYVPALGHAIVVDAAVPATCTSTGLTAGEHCTRCDYRVAQESIAALGHSIISHDAKAATCTEKGWNDYQTCARCDYSTYAEIAALGHDIVVDAAVPATCTATGLTAGEHCTRCDYKKAQETVPLIAHSYKNGVCTVCGAKDPNYKPAEPTKFNDVKENAWYYDAVNYAVQNGLMNGVGNGNFAPDSPMTRAMLVTVLWRYEGSPEEGTNGFTDVPNGQWYTKAVAWAATNGIVGGVGNNKFDPNGNITREQMAAILFRYANKKGFDTSKRGNLSGFPDKAKVSAYATDAIAWTVAEGIIGGSDGKLLPQGNATRAQVATILMRFIENIAHAK